MMEEDIDMCNDSNLREVCNTQKAVLFDLDGTLMDTEFYTWNLKRKIFEDMGYALDDIQIMQTVGMNFQRTVEKLVPNIQGDEMIEFQKRWKSHKKNSKQLLFEGILPLFKKLKEQKYLIAIVSNRNSKRLYDILKECGLLRYTNFIVSSDMVPCPKPDPAMYLFAMKQLNVNPHECVIVEDSQIGVQAGKQSGSFVICRKETRFPQYIVEADAYFINSFQLLDIIEHRF